MKRMTSLMMALFLVFGLLAGCTSDPGPADDGPGGVYRMTRTTVYTKEYDGSEEEFIYLENEYDEKARKVLTKLYNPEGLESYTEFKYYPESGMLSADYGYDPYGNPYFGSEYTYDEDGLLRRVNNSYPGGEDGSLQRMYTVRYDYDEDGNRIRETRFNRNMEPEDTLVYTYSKDGNVLKTEFFDRDGSLISWTGFDYKDGLLRDEVSYMADGDMEYSLSYEYDEDGLETGRFYHDYDMSVGRSIYTTRSKEDSLYFEGTPVDVITQTSQGPNGETEYIAREEYDRNGNLIYTVRTDTFADGSTEIYSQMYEYRFFAGITDSRVN